MLSYWCVLIVLLLPYVFAVMAKTAPGFDNGMPRECYEKLSGWRKRAHWAQVNAFEAFPQLAVGVIIANLAHANETTINTLAIVFVIARIFHGICYIAQKTALRSLFWLIDIICVIGLFVAAANA